ncbi:MAG TPA: hypothetical protein VGN72_19300 [Tepidisphaeraceae bacterium]|nr:hypothetical protein [Tepidisphaeraceae bacterium]
MVLGVGFIMIAAVFPVAIRQAQGTVEETTAARVLENAAATLPNLITVNNANPLDLLTDSFNYTGALSAAGAYYAPRDPRQPAALGTTLWDRTKGSFIDSADPRFAWTFFYRRDQELLPKAPHVIYGVSTIRNRPTFDAQDLLRFDSTAATPTPDDADEEQPWATLQPKLIRVILVNRADGPDTVEVLPAVRTAPTPVLNLTRVGGGNVPVDEVPDYTPAVGEGTLIIVSDDNVAAPYDGAPFDPTSPYLPGTLNGRSYRVVGRSSTPASVGGTVWDLAPGSDLASDKENLPPDPADRDAPADAPRSAIAFILGRGYANVVRPDPNNNGLEKEEFDGRVLDVAVRVGGSL